MKRLAVSVLAAAALATGGALVSAAPAHANYPTGGGTNGYVYGTWWGCYTYYGPQLGWRYSCA